MIDKRNSMLQIECDEEAKTFVVRLTVDFSKWTSIPKTLADSINKAIAEYKAKGLVQI